MEHIDTAQYYGPDVANDLIREALWPYPEELALVTKVGARRDAEGAWLPAQEPAELRSAVEDNLRSLKIERLAAVNLRRLDAPAAAPPIDDQLSELAAMREEGKIGGVGVSNVTLEEVRSAHEAVGVVCVQNAYSLVQREDDPLVDFCVAEGIAYVPFFPLGSAFPGMAKVTDDPAVRGVADRLGTSPAQVGLAWLLARSPNVLLIPGTSSVAHLEQNMAVAELVLSESDLAELTRSS